MYTHPDRDEVDGGIRTVTTPFPTEPCIEAQRFGGVTLMVRSDSGEGAKRVKLGEHVSSDADLVDSAGSRRDEQLAVISHELRNCVGALHNASRVLNTPQTRASAVRASRRLIERQIEQMTRLLDDLAEVSRVGSRPVQLQRQRIDLVMLVKHAVEDVAAEIGQRKHRVTMTLPDRPLWVLADPGRLEQVFINLLVNAAKYTGDGGDIALLVESRAGQASVRIRDSGIGIAPEMLPHVFGLFMQVQAPSPRADGGRGIGLAVVRSLIELHGGCVTARSDGLGQGSEFMVILPEA